MSVFSILHDIQQTLSTRFPRADAAHLHPYLRGDTPWPAERDRLVNSVRQLGSGVREFQASWRGGDAVVGQKKTVLLRIMVDWCNNQQSLLPLRSVLCTLTRPAPRTPFVQPQTLASPTNRLVALAQGMDLEVSLDDEDPSFGMSTTTTTSGSPTHPHPGRRIDTLALAGQRIVIDVEIAHPSPGVGEGWRLVSLRVERVDPEHLARGEGGMDVDPPPAAAARLLPAPSRVLQRYLETYLSAVNAYLASAADADDTAADAGETLELTAERAVLAFGTQLGALRAIDLQMTPLDGTAPFVLSSAGETLWDQLDEWDSLIQSTPGLFVPEPAVIPTFHLFPSTTFLPNPLCRIVRSATAPPAPDSQAGTGFTGWAVELDEPVSVVQGFFRPSDAGNPSGEHTLPDLCGATGPTTSRAPSGVQQGFLFPRDGQAALWLDTFGVGGKDDFLAGVTALRNAVWVRHFVQSCIRAGDPVDEEDDLDDTLTKLLTRTPGKPTHMTVIVRPEPSSIHLSFPLPLASEPVGTRPRMLHLAVRPEGETVTVDVDAEGSPVPGGLEGPHLGRRLVALRGDVPLWLDEVCRLLYR